MKEFSVVAASLELINLTGLTMSDLIARVSVLPLDTAIIYEGIWSGGTAVDSTPEAALSTIAAAANRPIVVDTEVWFGFGAAGGFLTRPALDGQVAAQLAKRILNGEAAANIPIVIGDVNRPVFDWRQLNRFGISEARLPPGSDIHFRSPSVWDQYRNYILLIITALVIQAVFIVWLIYEHRRRHVAEVKAQDAMSDLMHMNRISTVGEISGSIAHEVNQPLAAISAHTGAALNWLRSKTPDLDEIRAALTVISDETQRAGRIVHNLRAMFRKDTQESAQVDINKVILAVLDLMRIELQKNSIEVVTELSDRLPPANGREVQLQQVVFNLVMNAKEAMQGVPAVRELRVKSELNDTGQIQVSVEDSGTGIASSDIQRLFNRAFTTKASGMGMGLSICRTIIEGHGGLIWVMQGKPAGSIYSFALRHEADIPARLLSGRYRG